jgi:hypothetical protein
MALEKFEKQPADVQDYDISYVDWLADLSDTASSVLVTTDTGITQPTAATVALGIVKIWLSGGTSGVTYKVTCTLTTASSPARVKQVEILVKVKET